MTSHPPTKELTRALLEISLSTAAIVFQKEVNIPLITTIKKREGREQEK